MINITKISKNFVVGRRRSLRHKFNLNIQSMIPIYVFTLLRAEGKCLFRFDILRTY
jgi:hypothetical protein